MKAKLMAVIGLAFLLLVVMPFLIFVAVAWAMRAAGLVRAREVARFDAAGNALRDVPAGAVEM